MGEVMDNDNNMEVIIESNEVAIDVVDDVTVSENTASDIKDNTSDQEEQFFNEIIDIDLCLSLVSQEFNFSEI